MAKRTYEVMVDGFLLGDFYRAGDKVELHPEQARYDLPPHGTMLRSVGSAVDGSAEAAAAEQPAARAKKR